LGVVVDIRDLSGEDIVRLLLETAQSKGDPHRNALVEAIRRRFIIVIRANFAGLSTDCEDVVQTALLEVLLPRNLQQISEPTRFWAWAHRILINKAIDAADALQRQQGRTIGPPDDDEETPDEWLGRLFATWTNDPASLARHREILSRILPEIRKVPAAWMRMVLDAPEEEVARALGRTRDEVAQAVKRMRAKVRKLLNSWDT
jgi:RNA polymerase sigma factor (sigma-70 family)